MIAYVKGKLTYIQDESIIVEAMGIGYEIICPNPFIFQDLLENEVKIVTYHHVKEDAQILFGFKNEDEKFLFKKLISVSGIGPKGALAILSGVNIPEFVAAIEREDDKFLTAFPGVGKKTARQIILDLKGKLINTFAITDGVDKQHDAGDEKENNTALPEALEALKALGYTDRELRPIQQELKTIKAAGTDELIRKALSLLAK
ncbi:Holliday junction branch migration protein RuvA [Virgibacillus sp. 179-BFC.A HS]|uniref:Holliday junction branch migration complex subunit RuvA n=1 Tax=Tigheibacillus jepli TaxID=3035914 RepID=A0ABU5CGL0_9BACI|nr:Holliday junction branch migration protein RuvA [Virgibacillus sp. 179-BFC.A HS]MDY0405467.1 Holliday junction branch migration protein RuvA [Virgibacillus sp. 179-BFC.A HS]